MHAVLSHLVASAIALHTVLGCCWHHAHDVTPTAQASTSPSASAPAKSCHDCRCCRHAPDDHAASSQDAHDGHAAHDDSARHAPCHHGPKPCSNKCQFVTSGRVQTTASFAATFDFAPALGTSVLELDDRAARLKADDRPASPPPLRLHLLHQLLLI